MKLEEEKEGINKPRGSNFGSKEVICNFLSNQLIEVEVCDNYIYKLQRFNVLKQIFIKKLLATKLKNKVNFTANFDKTRLNLSPASQ